MTLIFTDSQVIRYAETRLFGSNLTPDEVANIELHNGELPSMLKEQISKEADFSLIDQKNSREPLYFQEGTLYIPQYSGHGRARRYQRMIEDYLRASGRNITFRTCDAKDEHGKHDPRQTNLNYDNFAYDFTVGLFLPEKYGQNRVFPARDIKDIDTIIFGSTEAVAKQAEVEFLGTSEYLDSQIVAIGNRPVLNIGYVYSDQAGRLLDNILREYDALAKRDGKDNTLNLFLFGEVGGLMSNLRRNQLVYPNGIIDETDLSQPDLPHRGEFMYPMHNILADEKVSDSERGQGHPTGLNLNVNSSILDETVEMLSLALEKGAICTDMELLEMVGAINRARTRYKNSSFQKGAPGLDIRFGFVGYVSDLPLEGDTRAEELEDDIGEKAAVRHILNKIKK